MGYGNSRSVRLGLVVLCLNLSLFFYQTINKFFYVIDFKKIKKLFMEENLELS